MALFVFLFCHQYFFGFVPAVFMVVCLQSKAACAVIIRFGFLNISIGSYIGFVTSMMTSFVNVVLAWTLLNEKGECILCLNKNTYRINHLGVVGKSV